MKKILLTTMLLIAASFSIPGQAADEQAAKKKAATSGELFETIARMDSAMFDAFNGHDVDRLMSMFTDDLDFYHDTGGVTNYEQTKESFGKLFANTPDIRRDLVKGSLEVYPIKDYGAIEIGEHVFCHKEKGKGIAGDSSSPWSGGKTVNRGKFPASSVTGTRGAYALLRVEMSAPSQALANPDNPAILVLQMSGNVQEIEQAIRTLPRTEIERLRNWIEDYLEDQLELTEEFKTKIEQGKRDIAQGRVRTRQPNAA
jgi:Domain of unknown function (DUF4440)